MKDLTISLHFLTGFILVLGGIGYIEDNPLTMLHTLIGFGLALGGIVLWILTVLLHQFLNRRV
jgi:hypothetical protein